MIREELLKRYNIPLISVKVSFIRDNKNNDLISRIIQCFNDVFTEIFKYKVRFKLFHIVKEGPALIMLIDVDPYEIKKDAVEIEEKHILGKCVDINVYNTNNEKILRTQLGFQRKKCFLCGGDIEDCINHNKHSEEEIVDYMSIMYKNYLQSYYGKNV